MCFLPMISVSAITQNSCSSSTKNIAKKKIHEITRQTMKIVLKLGIYSIVYIYSDLEQCLGDIGGVDCCAESSRSGKMVSEKL